MNDRIPSLPDGVVLNVLANTGFIIELCAEVVRELGHNSSGQLKSQLIRAANTTVEELALQKKQQVLLRIDEVQLLRFDLLKELRTFNQKAMDSKNSAD